MRELYPTVWTDRPTVRVGDRVRIGYNSRAIEAVILRFVGDYIVFKETNETSRNKWRRSSYYYNVPRGGRNFYHIDSEVWNRDPRAYEREKELRRQAHKEAMQEAINRRAPSGTSKSSAQRYRPNRIRNYNPEITKNKKEGKPPKVIGQQPILDQLPPSKERRDRKKEVIIYGSEHDKRFNWKKDKEIFQLEEPTFEDEETIDEDIAEDLQDIDTELSNSEKDEQVELHLEENLVEEPTNKFLDRHLRKIKKQEEKSYFYSGKEIPLVVKQGPVKSKQEIEDEKAGKKIEEYFTIRDKQTLLEAQQREEELVSSGFTRMFLEEDFFVHLLDTLSNVLRIEQGPQTIFIAPSELIVVGPKSRYSDVEMDRQSMSEEEKWQNLQLVGSYTLNFSQEIPVYENEGNDLNCFIYDNVPPAAEEECVTEVAQVTFEEPQKKDRSKKKPQKKTIPKNAYSGKKSYYDEDDDLGSVASYDTFSETGSEYSYSGTYENFSEYDDDNHHYIIFSKAGGVTLADTAPEQEQAEPVEVGEPKEIIINSDDYGHENMYPYEDEEIEFTENDEKDPELRNLKDLYDNTFITKGEYISRRNKYLHVLRLIAR